MSRPYYSLITKEYEGAPWSVQFGDYDKACVESELEYYREQGYLKKDLRVISSDPLQSEIDKVVNTINFRESAN